MLKKLYTSSMEVKQISICGYTIRVDLVNGEYRLLDIGEYRSTDQLKELINLALIKEGLQPIYN